MGIDDTSNFTEWPHVVCRAMTVLSTISNPVFFLAFSETFRESFCSALRNVTSVHKVRRQTMVRANKIFPTTSNGQQPKVYDEVSEIKSSSLKVCSLVSEQTVLGNRRNTSPCWTWYIIICSVLSNYDYLYECYLSFFKFFFFLIRASVLSWASSTTIYFLTQRSVVLIAANGA